MRLTTSFQESLDLWDQAGGLEDQLYLSFCEGELTYPIGLQERFFSYQDFDIDLTSFTNVTLIVDACFGKIECHKTSYINISVGDTIQSSDSQSHVFDVGNCTVTVRTPYPGDISDRVLYGQMCLSPCDENYSPSLDFHSPSYIDSNFTLQIFNLDVDYSNEVMNTQTHT